MSKLFTFLFIVLSTNFIFAQANNKSEIKKIDAYCKSVDSFVKKYKNPQLIFADVSQTEKEKWRKFSSEKALEKFRENTETYLISYNWQKNIKIIQTNFTFFSESGDWVDYVYHYFRADGTIAKVEIDYRTFYGDFMILRNIYFNGTGKILKKTTKYLDLKTHKPKQPDKEYLESNSNLINGVDYYKKTSKLPFAHLLK